MNYLKLTLGGCERGLKFNIGTLDQLNSLYGIDPLTFKAEGNDWLQLKPYIAKIMHAALACNCVIKGEEIDFTEADVNRWINEDLSVADLTNIGMMWNEIFSRAPSANGEVGKDTQLVMG